MHAMHHRAVDLLPATIVATIVAAIVPVVLQQAHWCHLRQYIVCVR